MSVNYDRDWSSDQGIGKSVAVSDSISAIDPEEAWANFAWLKKSSIWIWCPSINANSFNIVKSVIHPSVIAPVVPKVLGTVNDLLNWVFLLVFEENDWNTLNRTDCWKRIRGSTWTLIFDWTYSPKSNPIDNGTIGNGLNINLLVLLVDFVLTQMLSSELLFAEMSELIGAHFVGSSQKWIVAVDLLNVLLIDPHSVKILSFVEILSDTVLFFPGIELLLGWAFCRWVSIKNSSNCCSYEKQCTKSRLFHNLMLI